MDWWGCYGKGQAKMIRWLMLLFPCFVVAAEPAKFDLVSVPLNQVVTLYFKEVSKSAYVVCDDVLKDGRLVSIRADSSRLDSAMISAVLDSAGYDAVEKKGVVSVCKKQAHEADVDLFIYRPHYRDVSYLVDLMQPLFKGAFVSRRTSMAASVGKDAVGASPVSSGPSLLGSMAAGKEDVLLFSGSPAEIKKLDKLLPQLDQPVGEVVVKAQIFEVGSADRDGSALSLVASLLSGKLGLELTADKLANSIHIKTGTLDLVASALSGDSRFKVLTSPSSRVRSGSMARFVVGSEVPVLDAVVSDSVGQSRQSVTYRPSGVIFEVSPRVKRGEIELDLFQQLSNFVKTETGVSGSPTLNKREVRTSVSVADGEIIVIGGLQETKDTDERSTLFGFKYAGSDEKRKTEIVLMLEVKKVTNI